MSAPVYYMPPAGHRCRPDSKYDRPGTVRQCGECGQTWVGYRQQYVPGMQGQLAVATQWRPEGRFERWRRERRNR